jgi:uncharacterized integral membrane protein
MVQSVRNGTTTVPAAKRRLSGGAISSLVGLAVLIIFMVQNHNSVHINFLAWGFRAPLWLIMLASAVLGTLVWIGAGVMRRHRRRQRRREARAD